ncbi:hypothetical protein KIN20_016343 [Parelaphostrongylus tenuis]|uniref:Uncharacterized protein n=1 Tax=Parelaphostrongylus tenuis TaxID=148309 RepID=A0AAD5N1U0_PARTN|nr:hypothetical protein KIN20_016343 [Parelaphostrongylus tenuis]
MEEKCRRQEFSETKAISYIMYNVFEWFATTALLPNDSMGASLEQLKTDVSLFETCRPLSTVIN